MRILISAICLTGAALVACGGGSESDNSEESVEYKLAVVNAGGFVGEDDATVAEFSALLDRLEVKCPDTRGAIGDMAVTARQLLADKGVDRQLLLVMQDWDNSIPTEAVDLDCAGILATYVTITTQ